MSSIYNIGVTGLCYAGMAGLYNEGPRDTIFSSEQISPNAAVLYAVAGKFASIAAKSILNERLLKDPIVHILALPLLGVMAGMTAAKCAGYKFEKMDVVKLEGLRFILELVGSIAGSSIKNN